jgi:hypothetical protein
VAPDLRGCGWTLADLARVVRRAEPGDLAQARVTTDASDPVT